MPHAEELTCLYCQKSIIGYHVARAWATPNAGATRPGGWREIPSGGHGHSTWCFARRITTAHLPFFTRICRPCLQATTDRYHNADSLVVEYGQGHLQNCVFYGEVRTLPSFYRGSNSEGLKQEIHESFML